MNQTLAKINSCFYDPNRLIISNYAAEPESQKYGACRFEINGKKIISRNAQMTPKKVGQFVTTWKRSPEGITQPLDESDDFDLLVINVVSGEHLGQFIFPKKILDQKGIITVSNKEGKRGFRVYPPWNHPSSTQAAKTQAWQLGYFIKHTDSAASVTAHYA
ncbi:hypothetical protein SAMN04488029_2342 [Reichenbachiella faecimaris]|uniref:MepB protein n=1 Tax=Reichenbachiella faecimaris TaxID=692418 RepID=A0A1W2GEJ8_REIFA|nr:MepB family protein [Reichenbachiella faecimaris]SMD35099.1 hypothetical protein SAMN04488029_2342 [Reichenbachiella faecimaris]